VPVSITAVPFHNSESGVNDVLLIALCSDGTTWYKWQGVDDEWSEDVFAIPGTPAATTEEPPP